MAEEKHELSDAGIVGLFAADPNFADTERFAAQVQRAAAAQMRFRRLALIAAGTLGALIAFVAITASGVLTAAPKFLAPLREAASSDLGNWMLLTVGALVALVSLSWRFLFESER